MECVAVWQRPPLHRYSGMEGRPQRTILRTWWMVQRRKGLPCTRTWPATKPHRTAAFHVPDRSSATVVYQQGYFALYPANDILLPLLNFDESVEIKVIIGCRNHAGQTPKRLFMLFVFLHGTRKVRNGLGFGCESHQGTVCSR